MSNLKQIAGIFCLLLSGTVLLPSLLAAEPVEDRARKRVLIIGNVIRKTIQSVVPGGRVF